MLDRALQDARLSSALLVLLGLATRLAFIWYPNEVVFDEVHFGSLLSAYYTHQYYFDIHPPLGKLLMAGWGKLFGCHASLRFDHIGQVFGDSSYIVLRALPNIAGGLIPVVLYRLLGALSISRPAALLAASFILFDNAFLAQSHFVLIDSFYLLFGFSGLWWFFRAKQKGYRILDLTPACAALALSVSVKWVGLGFLGLAAVVMMANQARVLTLGRPRAPLKACASISALLGIPAVVYAVIFWIHLAVLPRAGAGDPFMSTRFQNISQGSSRSSESEFQAVSLVTKVWEMNRSMLAANQTLKAGHPYESKFYTWPFMSRPVSYWKRDFIDGKTGYIYCLGNPAVWWLSTFGVMGGLFTLIKNWSSLGWTGLARDWLYVGYALSFLPFALISRAMFLYHYLPALAYSGAILAALLFDEWDPTNRRQRTLWISLLVMTLLGFLFFSPLSYGWPLDSTGYQSRMWFRSWI